MPQGNFMVFVVSKSGDLRCYHPEGNDVNTLIANAMEQDKNDYPNDSADWGNVSIVKGVNLYDIVQGEVL